MGSGDHRERHDHRGAGGQGRQATTTSPTTWPTRPSSGSTGCAPRTRTSRGSSYFSTGCAHAPAPGAPGMGRQVQGQVRQRLGRLPRGDLRPAEAARRDPGRRGADTSQRGVPGLGVAAGGPEGAVRPPDGGVRRVLRERRLERRAGCSTRSRRWASSTTPLVIYIWGDNGATMEGTLTGTFNELTMQNGIPLTAEQQLALIEQYGGLDVWGTELDRPALRGGVGVGGQLPVPVGQAGRLAPGWHPQPAWPSAGRRGSPTPGRAALPVHPLHRHRPDHPRDRGHPGARPMSTASSSSRSTARQLPATRFADASAPEHHTQQYFEIMGYRAMYKDGWWLSMMPPRIPWDLDPAADAEPRARGVGPRRRPGGAVLPAR